MRAGLLLPLLAVALAGCGGKFVPTVATGAGAGGGGTTVSDTTLVQITDTGYQPVTVTIAVGHTVTWTNYGTGPHSATSDTLLWDSRQLNGATTGAMGQTIPGQSFSFTFDTAGTYPYHDTVDTLLTGTVVVTP